MSQRFIAEGATVVIFDLKEETASVAQRIGAHQVTVDVANAELTAEAIDWTEREVGLIDVYCGNAGVLVQGGLEVPDERWAETWQVNVMANVHAARIMVPRWVDRGGGYLLITASAAGLLTGLGALPYSVGKHAIVSMAEWIAIEHHASGVRVSCLCPQSVDTPMHHSGGDDAGALAATGMTSGVLTPESVAEEVINGLRDERFLILPHPEVATFMQRKAADYDRWLNGMSRLRERMRVARAGWVGEERP
jgi:NAD(P)-dependent dehydrogenase (short-subunit alcohol dehydrogenase family)